MGFQETLYKVLQKTAGGFHAVPADNPNPLKAQPALHRFFNVIGMMSGFVGVKYVADIMYGHRINGSKHEIIAKDAVPFVLRPLHGIIKANPHSDAKRDKELTIVHKMLPAVGGAVGAIAGSTYFFSQNGTSQRIKGMIEKLAKDEGLSDVEKAVMNASIKTYRQGKLWRVAAGATAWPSSVSGLTGLLYGTSLNTAFWLGNNSKKAPTPAPTKNRIMWAAGEMAAVIAGLGIAASWLSRKRNTAAKKVDLQDDLSGVGAQQYVDAVGKKNRVNEKRGLLNGKVLAVADWMADSALSVVPVHRVWASIGLTAGGAVGLMAGKLLTGNSLAGGPGFNNDKLPGVLKKINGIMKAEPVKYSDIKNKFLIVGGKYIFAACCAVGVMIGSKHAYKSTYKRNENPDSLEDYIARVRQHHGDKMIPFIASSSIFGSAAGTYLVPIIPGINYGSSLAYRVVSMQDRNITAPVLDKLTGNTTSSYFGLREGLEHICKYAVRNPSQRPEQFEYLAYTVMGPLAHAAGVELKGQNIKQFVDKINNIRDKYWVEGGIPEEKQPELEKELNESLRGKGLDRTLYECGVDTAKIEFKQIGGLIGRFARIMGAEKKIEREQAGYRKMLSEWRDEWSKENISGGENQVDEVKEVVISGTANTETSMLSQHNKLANRQQKRSMKDEYNKKSVAFNGMVTSYNGVNKTVGNSSPLRSSLEVPPEAARI